MGDKTDMIIKSSIGEKEATTNLYVHNLAPDLTEDILKREFGRFGPVASVKVMWPRDDDPVKRSSNVGFVAFMDRASAARCIDNLNGEMLHGYELRIGWGKSVPLPSSPVFNQMDPSLIVTSQPPEEPTLEASNEIQVSIPEDLHLRFIIDTLASFVIKDGFKFEEMIRKNEANNPAFAFLFEAGSEADAYYRWKLFTLMQGDSMRRWRLEPFNMVEGGPIWKPPNMCTGDGSQLTAAQRGEGIAKRKLLSDLERHRLEKMLEELKADKAGVCDAMVFAMKNAEAAEEVVDILAASLSQTETSVATRVARLFVVSDILNNSSASVRNASQYRSRLQEKLPDVFESFQAIYASLHEDKPVQDNLKKYILRVLRVWRNWFIFSNDYLNGLQSTFLSSQISDAQIEEHRTALGHIKDEEIERRCRFNGLSLKGGPQLQRFRCARLDVYIQGEEESTQKKQKSKIKKQPCIPKTAKRNVTLQKRLPESKTSGWVSVEQEQEKKPDVPVSQWLQQKNPQEEAKSVPVDSAVSVAPLQKTETKIIENPDFDMFEADDDETDQMGSSVERSDNTKTIKRQKTDAAS